MENNQEGIKQENLQEVEVEEQNQKYVGKRIIFKHEKATILYAGKLVHPIDNPKVKPNDLWFGVEWDNSEKGNLTYNSIQESTMELSKALSISNLVLGVRTSVP